MTEEKATDVGGSGYTLAELSEYLDSGRTPRIAAIEDNAECQAVLDSMIRLQQLSGDLVAEEASAAGLPGAQWFDGILRVISQELRAGKELAFGPQREDTRIGITEGALRELIRTVGDEVPGVLIGRARLRSGDDGQLLVEVAAAVAQDRPMAATADELRAAIATALERHSPGPVVTIDVVITDIAPADEENE